MRSKTANIALAVVGVIAVAVWWFGFAPRLWGECRNAGHSRLYCSTVVAR